MWTEKEVKEGRGTDEHRRSPKQTDFITFPLKAPFSYIRSSKASQSEKKRNWTENCQKGDVFTTE